MWFLFKKKIRKSRQHRVSRNRHKGQFMKAGNQGGQGKSDMEMKGGYCHENLRCFNDHIKRGEPRN